MLFQHHRNVLAMSLQLGLHTHFVFFLNAAFRLFQRTQICSPVLVYPVSDMFVVTCLKMSPFQCFHQSVYCNQYDNTNSVSSAPHKCNAFFPIIVSNLRITAGVCHVIHVRLKHMRTLVRTAIMRLRCLHAYATYVNTIMLAAMSLIGLFRWKYCVDIR